MTYIHSWKQRGQRLYKQQEGQWPWWHSRQHPKKHCSWRPHRDTQHQLSTQFWDQYSKSPLALSLCFRLSHRTDSQPCSKSGLNSPLMVLVRGVRTLLVHIQPPRWLVHTESLKGLALLPLLLLFFFLFHTQQKNRA